MDPSNTSTFARTLRDLRQAAGLSQELLAQRSGLSLRGISDLERGARKTPRLETVRLLAEGLGLDPSSRETLLSAARPRRDPPRAGRPSPGGPPCEHQPLIGRSFELRAIERLLVHDHVPLVTLTGPGGVGKTSLAIAVANAVADHFADGVTFVPLGPLIDPRLVVLALGEALGLRGSSLAAMTASVLRELHRRQTLLVLDNFEHLMGAATLVSDLVASCPGLRVLVTSRERLRLHGEQVMVVHPLDLPDPQAPTPVDVLTEVPAVELFLRRVRDVAPEFHLNEANAGAVAAICHRLDGLPLALELAASWVRILSPDELLARLEQRLPMLRHGPRDAHQRHQTLSNAIAWSYHLLPPVEQRMFRWMGVFIGGVDLAAVEGVAGHDLDPAAGEVVGILASLVDKSLIRRVEGASPRFTMLETIREFALAELETAGEREMALSRHAAWYVGLGERMQEHLLRAVDSHWLDRLEVDHGNLRNALVWMLITSSDPASARLGLRLARSLWLFWYYHNHLAEGRWWLERALAATAGTRDADRAMALVGLGTLAHAQGDEDASLAWLSEGLEMSREAGDPTVTAFALSVSGNWAEDSGQYDDAARLFTEANRIFSELDDAVNVAITGYHLGVVAFGKGNIAESGHRCLEALALSRRMDDSWGTAASQAQLGLVRIAQGAFDEAADALDEALTLYSRIASKERIADTLCRIAVLAAECGDYPAAIRLFSDAAQVRGEVGTVQALPEREVYELAIRRSRAALGEGETSSVVGTAPVRLLESIIKDAHLVLMEIADASAAPVEPP